MTDIELSRKLYGFMDCQKFVQNMRLQRLIDAVQENYMVHDVLPLTDEQLDINAAGTDNPYESLSAKDTDSPLHDV